MRLCLGREGEGRKSPRGLLHFGSVSVPPQVDSDQVSDHHRHQGVLCSGWEQGAGESMEGCPGTWSGCSAFRRAEEVGHLQAPGAVCFGQGSLGELERHICKPGRHGSQRGGSCLTATGLLLQITSSQQGQAGLPEATTFSSFHVTGNVFPTVSLASERGPHTSIG